MIFLNFHECRPYCLFRTTGSYPVVAKRQQLTNTALKGIVKKWRSGRWLNFLSSRGPRPESLAAPALEEQSVCQHLLLTVTNSTVNPNLIHAAVNIMKNSCSYFLFFLNLITFDPCGKSRPHKFKRQ